MGQHHGHHHHHHGPSADGSLGRMALAFTLNLSFAVIELVGGIWTNSVAILSDALHDFGDALAIGVAFALERVSRKMANSQYSYGYRRYSTAAAVITGMVLVFGAVFILIESVPRLLNPQTPHTGGMILLAFLGLAVNGFAAWRVSKGTSLSERMIVWHLMEDVMGWVAVLIGALIMRFFGYPQIDAALGCILAVWILFNVVRNLKEAFMVFLQVVPANIDLKKIEEKITTVNGVRAIHHSHLWSLDGEQHIFTAHLVVGAELVSSEVEKVKRAVKDLLAKEQISEATLEIECEGTDCVDPQHKSPTSGAAAHDHQGHDHDGHDHSGHDHSHGHKHK